MKKTEYNQLREKLKLSIIGAAPVLGVSKRHAQRFAAGEVEIPKPVAKLLKLAARLNVPAAEI